MIMTHLPPLLNAFNASFLVLSIKSSAILGRDFLLISCVLKLYVIH